MPPMSPLAEPDMITIGVQGADADAATGAAAVKDEDDKLDAETYPTRPSFTISEVPSESPVTTSPPPQFLQLDEEHRPTRQVTIDNRTLPKSIPPSHERRHRTLVLCFDGTGDQFDNGNSNVVELFKLLKKDDKGQQMCYYQAGIGTYVSPQKVTKMTTKISKAMDMLIAWNLDAHVMDGYEFLMQNYIAGDRICLFGFSRGAYTARSLAGMLLKVGLLPSDNWQQVPFAYKMYTAIDRAGWEQSLAFKKAFSVDVDIEFIGAWDTVNSVGLIPRRLPFTVSNTLVRTFRHALSLDERRAKFKANLWHVPNPHKPSVDPYGGYLSSPFGPFDDSEPEQQGKENAEKSEGEEFERWLPRKITELSRSISRSRDSRERKDSEKRKDTDESSLTKMEKKFSVRRKKPTDVKEVWFSGCHCDVGGGSVSNNTRHSLARIPLRWMVRECFKANTGIMFDVDKLREIGMDPTSLWPFVTPRPEPKSSASMHVQEMPKEAKGSLHRSMSDGFKGIKRKWSKRQNSVSTTSTSDTSGKDKMESYPFLDEEDEELRDALSPVYDQLKVFPPWWALEYIPMHFKGQGRSGDGSNWYGMNRGKPRIIPRQHKYGLHVHRSVKMRMEADPPEPRHPESMLKKNSRWKRDKYKPRASFEAEPIWVD